MDTGIISKRYAKALLEFANGSGVEDRIYNEATALRTSFQLLPKLGDAMINPVISTDVKQKLLFEAAGGKTSKEFMRFIDLVLKEKREKNLVFMMNSFITLYRKQKNISRGKLITAYPVADEVVQKIRKIVVDATHGTIEFTTSTEPSIEGGFIFEIGTYRLDASVANQMKRVKKQFLEKNRRIV